MERIRSRRAPYSACRRRFRFRPRLLPVLLAALACQAGPVAAAAAAASPDLASFAWEDLLKMEVYSASKFQQTTSEAPSAVTVITAEEIKVYGHRTLADILRSIRTVYVSYDRNYSYIGGAASGARAITTPACCWTATGSRTTFTTVPWPAPTSSWTSIGSNGWNSCPAPARPSTVTTPSSA